MSRLLVNTVPVCFCTGVYLCADYFVCTPKKVLYDVDGGCYELLTFSSMDGNASGTGPDGDARRGPCLAAVFLSRNRFAVLDKNRQVRESRGRNAGVGETRTMLWDWSVQCVRFWRFYLSLPPPSLPLIPMSQMLP